MKTAGQMTIKHWSHILVERGACDGAITYATQFPSFETAWTGCANPSWLFWWLGRNVPDTPDHRRNLTCIAIRITLAIPARSPIPGWDSWAEAYLRGAADSAASAAIAADSAATAADSAANAADSATGSAANAAHSAAISAARSAAYSATDRAACHIIRDVYPVPVGLTVADVGRMF